MGEFLINLIMCLCWGILVIPTSILIFVFLPFIALGLEIKEAIQKKQRFCIA